jgi:hypothetical protein
MTLTKFLALIIVTDYRLNANHNYLFMDILINFIVTDYRLNANHNLKSIVNHDGNGDTQHNNCCDLHLGDSRLQ